MIITVLYDKQKAHPKHALNRLMMTDLADVHSCLCVGQEFSSFEELNSALKL